MVELLKKIKDIIENTENSNIKWFKENNVTFYCYSNPKKYIMSIQKINGSYNGISYVYQIRNLVSNSQILFLNIDKTGNGDLFNMLSLLYESVDNKYTENVIDILQLFIEK